MTNLSYYNITLYPVNMKTLLITPEGLEKLKAELDHLWRVERPDTTQKVAWAASLGDRSENADYHYNKKRLREIDRRVLYLRKRITDLKVVNYSPCSSVCGTQTESFPDVQNLKYSLLSD